MSDICYDDCFRLTIPQITEIQLKGAQRKFAELRPQLPVLDKLATEQGVTAINEIDDIAPLLFPHTVYKSYPLSYLEKCRFDKLTKWLDGLTTEDLSGVDAKGVETIDAWLDLLEEKTGLLPQHTSGTTGKLSFIPRSKAQWRQLMVITNNIIRDWNGCNSGPDMQAQHRPIIVPGYRHGASATQRGNNFQVELFAGSEDNALFTYPTARFSADVASLAGRLRAAEARGEQGALEISPGLLARRAELAELEKRRPQDMQNFFDTAAQKFGGKDVYISALWATLYDWADEGLKRGFKNIFGPGSALLTGGGKKGTDMPDNWRERVLEFLGFDTFYEMYGVSELIGLAFKCKHGHYHFPPTLIPFVLDRDTGRPLPRKDDITGRLALFDLLPNTYWPGLVTGDEVTVSGWETPCACGRVGPYLNPQIRRYSDIEGGDDKIICAGAPEAHDQALAFLSELSA